MVIDDGRVSRSSQASQTLVPLEEAAENWELAGQARDALIAPLEAARDLRLGTVDLRRTWCDDRRDRGAALGIAERSGPAERTRGVVGAHAGEQLVEVGLHEREAEVTGLAVPEHAVQDLERVADATMPRMRPGALALLLLLVLPLGFANLASAGAPRGYKCGAGKKLAGKGCECPAGMVDARDKKQAAICIPEPAPTSCLAARPGNEVLKIDSTPDAATIYIGDKACGSVGVTPWTGKLAAGPVNIILERTSFEPVARTITVTPRATQELFVPLVRTNVGSLDVRGDADANVVGAKIFVDGKQLGVVPIAVQVAGGRRQIEIKRDGFDVFSQWVEVQDSQTIVILPVLKVSATKQGKLIIDADVTDVEVLVDEVKQVGAVTPLVLVVNEGAHTVEVRKPGATAWRQTVTVAASRQTLVRAELARTMKSDRDKATVIVSATVPGAEVFIDGTTAGKVPQQLAIAPGEHWVIVKLAGHKSFEQKLRLDPGQSFTITANLRPTAELRIVSSPVGAAVFVDRVRVGSTPVSVELELGEHAILLDRSGYQRYESHVTLTGPPQTISVVLTK